MDSSYFDISEMFRGSYQFQLRDGKIKQFSDLYDSKFARERDTAYILIKDSPSTISSYLSNIKKRNNKSPDASIKYYYVYNESEINTRVSYEIFEKVKVAQDFGLESEQILMGLSRTNAESVIISKAIYILKNLPSERVINTLDATLSDEDLLLKTSETFSSLKEKYLFDGQLVSSAIEFLIARRLNQILASLHLKI